MALALGSVAFACVHSHSMVACASASAQLCNNGESEDLDKSGHKLLDATGRDDDIEAGSNAKPEASLDEGG